MPAYNTEVTSFGLRSEYWSTVSNYPKALRHLEQAVSLTKSELLILAALVRQRGFVLTRDRLLDLAKGGEVVVTDRTVDTFIKRIRKKVKAVDEAFDEIETVIGVGYKYRGGA